MSNHTSLVIKDEKTFNEIKRLAGLDGKDVSELTFEIYEEYVKVHGSGNPAFTLDQFQDEGMKALPAFMANFKQVWIPYFQKSNNEALDEINEQANDITIFSAAYRNVKPSERDNVGFPSKKDALAKAGFLWKIMKKEIDFQNELKPFSDLKELISFVENVKKQKRIIIDERAIQSIQYIPNSFE